MSYHENHLYWTDWVDDTSKKVKSYNIWKTNAVTGKSSVFKELNKIPFLVGFTSKEGN